MTKMRYAGDIGTAQTRVVARVGRWEDESSGKHWQALSRPQTMLSPICTCQPLAFNRSSYHPECLEKLKNKFMRKRMLLGCSFLGLLQKAFICS